MQNRSEPLRYVCAMSALCLRYVCAVSALCLRYVGARRSLGDRSAAAHLGRGPVPGSGTGPLGRGPVPWVGDRSLSGTGPSPLTKLHNTFQNVTPSKTVASFCKNFALFIFFPSVLVNDVHAFFFAKFRKAPPAPPFPQLNDKKHEKWR